MKPPAQFPEPLLARLLDEAPTGLIVLRGGVLAHVNARAAEWLACRCAGVGALPSPAGGLCRASCTQLRDASTLCEQAGSATIVMDGSADGALRLEVALRTARVADETFVVGAVRPLGEGAATDESARIGWRAYHDPLTHLPNRATFLERVGALAAGSGPAFSELERRRGFALLMVDLDGFKAVNDSAGHEAGDRVLTVTAQRFLDAVRGTDTVARLGGDEFAVLAPGVDSPEGAERIAAALVSALAAPIAIGDRSFGVGCSVGIARFPHDATTAEALLVCADAAMYAAKHAGRNRYLAHGTPAVRELLEARPPASAPRWVAHASIGVARVDQQHDRLLRQFARIDKLARSGSSSVEALQQAQRLLVELVRETAEHFAAEEELLRLDRASNGEAHRRAHAVFLANLRRIAGDFNAHVGSVVSLVDAFLDHIETMDRPSALCLFPPPEPVGHEEGRRDTPQ